jgi:coatomer protein complex subunit alpha (xenin)
MVLQPFHSFPSYDRLLELNPGAKIAEQVRGVLATCEKGPTDAVKIKYDPRNPFDICSSTFSAIYKVNNLLHCED